LTTSVLAENHYSTWYVHHKGQTMLGSRPEGPNQAISEREKRWRGYLVEIARGDSQSLARLYDECAASLLGLALRMMRNKADAEEIILDVFDQVWRTAHTFDEARGSVWRWLTLIVRSRALDRLRTAASKRDRDKLALAEDWDVVSNDPLPDSTTIFNEERTLIRSALQRLPGEQRHAIELAFFSGLTHVEIASQLGVPLGTIKTRIRAAMDKLRISLAQGGLAAAESAR
jgi:RNA polymerase sigma-70 factor (ECF subfamily)